MITKEEFKSIFGARGGFTKNQDILNLYNVTIKEPLQSVFIDYHCYSIPKLIYWLYSGLESLSDVKYVSYQDINSPSPNNFKNLIHFTNKIEYNNYHYSLPKRIFNKYKKITKAEKNISEIVQCLFDNEIQNILSGQYPPKYCLSKFEMTTHYYTIFRENPHQFLDENQSKRLKKHREKLKSSNLPKFILDS